MNQNKYTKELLTPLVASVKSLAALLKLLKLQPSGGNYQQINGYISLYKIDTSHFTGQLWNKGIKTGPNSKLARPLSTILIDNSVYGSSKLRERLIKENLIKNECVECGQKPLWNGKLLVLQLDHINGNRNDNRLENLRILCPNCHTQTSTHSGKNK
jgi:hypothetical protein